LEESSGNYLSIFPIISGLERWAKTALTVIKLGSNFFIKSGFGAAFLGAAQQNIMIEVLAAVTWLCPYLAQAVLIKPDQAVSLVWSLCFVREEWIKESGHC
jgi:hypothetical protein